MRVKDVKVIGSECTLCGGGKEGEGIGRMLLKLLLQTFLQLHCSSSLHVIRTYSALFVNYNVAVVMQREDSVGY